MRKKGKIIEKVSASQIITSAMLLITVALYMVPLYITVVNVFKSTETVGRSPFSLPFPGTLENFIYVFTNPNVKIFRMYFNTFIITASSLVLIIIVSSMAGYYTSRSTAKAGRGLYIFFILGLMIPYQIILIPIVMLYKRLHLMFTLQGIILLYIACYVSFSIFMYHGFIKSVPKELEESAAIDGANPLRLFWQIIFPLLKPCTATTAIFSGLFMWNDFLTPLIILGGGRALTITLGIYTSIGPYQAEWGHIFAFVILATLPILIVYLAMQKQFIAGLTAGSVKG